MWCNVKELRWGAQKGPAAELGPSQLVNRSWPRELFEVLWESHVNGWNDQPMGPERGRQGGNAGREMAPLLTPDIHARVPDRGVTPSGAPGTRPSLKLITISGFDCGVMLQASFGSGRSEPVKTEQTVKEHLGFGFDPVSVSPSRCIVKQSIPSVNSAATLSNLLTCPWCCNTDSICPPKVTRHQRVCLDYKGALLQASC